MPPLTVEGAVRKQKQQEENEKVDDVFAKLMERGLVLENEVLSFMTPPTRKHAQSYADEQALFDAKANRKLWIHHVSGVAKRGGLLMVLMGKNPMRPVVTLSRFALRHSQSKARPLSHVFTKNLVSLEELTETPTYRYADVPHCGVCLQVGESGRLNRCDACSKSYHAKCAHQARGWRRPPEWSCPWCLGAAPPAFARGGIAASAAAGAAVEAEGRQPPERKRKDRDGGAHDAALVPVAGKRRVEDIHVRMQTVEFIGQAIRRAGLVVRHPSISDSTWPRLKLISLSEMECNGRRFAVGSAPHAL